jgi:uracil-DNA glycosylase
VMAGKGFLVKPRPSFKHGVVHKVPGSPVVIGSYHPSRQNTNTGKLTPRMMAAVFRTAASVASPKPGA